MKCEQCDKKVKAMYHMTSRYSIGYYGDQFIVQIGTRMLKIGIFDTLGEAQVALKYYLIHRIEDTEQALVKYKSEYRLWEKEDNENS